MWRTSSGDRLLATLALILGLGVLGLVIAVDRLSERTLHSEALANQSLRAEELARRLEIHLTAAVQVARTVSEVIAPMTSQREVEELLRRALQSSSEEYVYGIGAWFEPFAFDRERRLVGPYVHRDLEEPARLVLTYDWSDGAYDYHRQPWYQQGAQANRQTVFTEPYFDTDFVYRTIARPFYDAQGGVRGVVSIDVVLPQLRELVRKANLHPRESLYVLTGSGRVFAHPREAELLAWAVERGRVAPGAMLTDLTLGDLERWEAETGQATRRLKSSATVGAANWTVYASTDRERLLSSGNRFRLALFAAGGALLLTLLALVIAARYTTPGGPSGEPAPPPPAAPPSA